MHGRVRLQAGDRLDALPLGADSPAASQLIGEDDGMHESLEEVALARGRRAPRELEMLVCREVVASPRKLEAVQAKLRITPNFTRVMANSPAVLEGYLGFSGALTGGSLPAKQCRCPQ